MVTLHHDLGENVQMTTDNSTTTTKPSAGATRMQGSNKSKGLADLFLHGIQDIYYAEKKLTKALPKMIKAAKSQDLIDVLSSHVKETEEHVEMMEEIFQSIGKPIKAKKCEAIDGIVAEADAILKEFGGTSAGDAAIIFAAQAAEHYEITRYGSLRAFAEILKYSDVEKTIRMILNEEKKADEKLSQIAEDRIDWAANVTPEEMPSGPQSSETNDKHKWRLWS